MEKTTPPKKRALPAALAKVDERAVAAKKRRVLEQLAADVALVERKAQQVADAFYDIGEALARMRRPGVAELAGYEDFWSLCAARVPLSRTVVEALLAIVSHYPREIAIGMTQTKALAYIELAEAMGDGTKAAELSRATIETKQGVRVTPTSSAQDVQRAAREIRQSHGKAHKGRTTTPEERAACAEIERMLRGRGLARATVTAVATKPGQPADVRIEHAEIAALVPILRAGLAKRTATKPNASGKKAKNGHARP